jgi:hypothetical protein
MIPGDAASCFSVSDKQPFANDAVESDPFSFAAVQQSRLTRSGLVLGEPSLSNKVAERERLTEFGLDNL